MGLCHGHCFGFAKFFTKVLNTDTKIIHNTEVIGAGSLIWSHGLLCPLKLHHVEGLLDEAQLPHIVKCNVSKGKFQLEFC